MNKEWRRRPLLLLLAAAVALACQREPISLPAGGGAQVELASTAMPLVALTFDDGPRNSTTGPLLEGLALREVCATFFLVGSRIQGSEALIREMAAAGHQVGVHTYDHVMVTDLSRRDFDLQVGKTRACLAQLLGRDNFPLRPPYGLVDAGVKNWAGSPIILWSVDPKDWGDQNTPREVSLILQEVKDGSIILLHDIFAPSVEAALQVIDRLHERGYLFVTIEELFAARGIPLEAGQVYWNAYP